VRIRKSYLPVAIAVVFVVTGICVPLLAGAATPRPNARASATSVPIPNAPATTFLTSTATTTTEVSLTTTAGTVPCGPSSATASLAGIEANAGTAVLTVSITTTSGCALPTSPGAALVPLAATTISPAAPVLQASRPPEASGVSGASAPSEASSPSVEAPAPAAGLPSMLAKGTDVYLQIAFSEATSAQSESAPLIQSVRVQLPGGALDIPEFLRPAGTPSLVSVSTQPPTPVAAPACTSNDLQATVLPGPGGAGNVALTIGLTNASSGTCTLNGYPAIQLYDSAGAPLISNQQNGAQSWLGPPEASAPVTLAPQGAVSFNITARDIGGQAPCAVGQEMSITPPGTSTALTVPVTAAACNGTVTVGAFQPGETPIQ
jgi:Protein of unknown function (DUF4232)